MLGVRRDPFNKHPYHEFRVKINALKIQYGILKFGQNKIHLKIMLKEKFSLKATVDFTIKKCS